ncbi:hypothetical protein [Nocardioides sp. J54]|uniref:hypothetical protein n=1 Tax=Nocardioides sp. J54 TaxID=935866 RepID=UPI00048BDDD2|nr:hypothetical protein [Nocardioides sp. J54]
MRNRPDTSLGARRTTDGAVLVDLACGSCGACADGATLWCRRPLTEGRDLTPVLPVGRVGEAIDALLGVAALAEAPADAAVLLLTTPGGPLAVLAATVVAGRLVVTTDPDEARAELAGEPTGRAGVVVAGADARTAVRMVRRGGHVVVAGADLPLPSVTELVQREVTLLAPREVAGTATRIEPRMWAAFAVA